MGGRGGAWNLSSKQKAQFRQVYMPWADRIHRRIGKYALLNVYYEKEWDTNLTELRDRLGLEEAPRC